MSQIATDDPTQNCSAVEIEMKLFQIVGLILNGHYRCVSWLQILKNLQYFDQLILFIIHLSLNNKIHRFD